MIRSARQRGFEVHLIYVSLDSPERNIQRVKERVAAGGHHVPDEDVRRRYERSLANLAEACRISSEATVYDNSGDVRRKVLEVTSGRIVWIADSPPEWIQKLLQQIA